MLSPNTLPASREPDLPARHLETRLVHDGILRSQYGETAETLFLTQGFIYDRAETAEARFKNEDPGYQYSRFANPTVTMFEDRLASLEGAEACRATATSEYTLISIAVLKPSRLQFT